MRLENAVLQMFGCQVLAAMLLAAVQIQAQPLSPAEIQYRQDALLRGEQLADSPDLHVSRSKSSNTSIELDFDVVRIPAEQKATIALVIPSGTFTTGSVSLVRRLPFADKSGTTDKLPVTLEPLGYVRGYKIGRANFSVAPTTIMEEIVGGTLRVEFNDSKSTGAADTAWQERESTGPIRAALEKLVANPDDLSRFLAPNPAQIPGDSTLPWNPVGSGSSFRLRVPIDKDGVYQFTGLDLASSGVKLLDLKPDSLRLLLEGESQPLHFLPEAGNARAAATAGDRWAFYGRQNTSKYTTTNTYWLVADPTIKPMPMQPASRTLSNEPAERAQIFPFTASIRQENLPVLTKNDQFLTILGFHWAWWTWTEGRGAVPEPTPLNKPRQFSFDLPGLYVSGGNVKATAFFYPHVWPSMQEPVTVRIKINEAPPAEVRIENATDEQKSFDLPATALRETGNTAVLELVDAVTSVPGGARRQQLELAFEQLQVQYQRLYKAGPEGLKFTSSSGLAAAEATTSPLPQRSVEYNVTDVPATAQPLVLDITDTATLFVQHERVGDTLRLRVKESSPRSYQLADLRTTPHATIQPLVVGDDLRAESNAADYVIVTHPLFKAAVQQFAQRKSTDRHLVKVVDIEDIYDQFAAGQKMPHALRAFIRYATSHWKGGPLGPAASYVLFVGDSTSAYRDEFRNGVYNYVPSMTVGESGDRFASDHWFASAFGDDLLADNLLGRFSVNNLNDLNNLLQKQSSYRTTAAPEPWPNTLAYVADHSDFETTVQNIMHQSVPSRFFLRRIFMSEQPWIDNYYFPLEVAEAKKSKVSPVTTAKIRDMFNEGAAMVTYFGHGSPNVWSNERIWFGGDSENSDNRMLTNRDKLSFIINMTCNSGAIDYPMPRWNICISEDFMRISNGGAIACYVPSGPGITNQHERLTLQLNRAILEERLKPVGPALALANWRYLLNNNPPDLVRMFIYMGDPALELKLAEPVATPGAGDDSGFVQSLVREHDRFDASHITTVTQSRSINATDTSGSSALLVHATAVAEQQSGAVPVATMPNLTVVNHARDNDGLVTAGQTVRYAFRIQNSSRTPVKDAILLLKRDQRAVTTSEKFELVPSAEKVIKLSVTAEEGVAAFDLVAQINGKELPLQVSNLLPLVGVSGTPTDANGLVIDHGSLQKRYSPNGSDYNAVISFRAFNALATPISSAVASVAGSKGTALTTAAVSMVSPGAAAQVALSIPLSSTTATEQLTIRLTSGTLEFKQSKPVEVNVSIADVPDLMIIPGSLRASNPSPSDGETVIFQAVVANNGRTAVESARIDGYSGPDTSVTERMESRVTSPLSSFTVEPGSTRTIEVRWDPFHNAGTQHIELRASSAVSADRDLSNNVAKLELTVRTKAKVRPVGIRVLDLTAEDKAKLQIRVSTTLRNEGQSDAQGIRVVFYPTPKRVPKDAMGDVILDVLPAGQSRDAILTYKLKPGEEKFPFVPSCETMLKGSLQRTPSTPEGS